MGVWRLHLLVPLLMLTACASIPVDTVRSYADSFEQARKAGDLLLDEISPIVSGGERSDSCAPSPLGFPQCFDPRVALGDGSIRENEDMSIRARRDALEAVTIYNKLLVELVEGRTVEGSDARIDQLAGLAKKLGELGVVTTSRLSALVVPGAAFLKDLADRLDSARASEAVRNAIIESEADIRELLVLMTGDTPIMFAIFRDARQIDLVRHESDKKRAELSGKEKEAKAAAERIAATVEAIRKFHESLTAYVQLLDQTSQALVVLVEAAEAGPDPVETVALVLQQAQAIREKSDEFWKKIREVRAAAAQAQA